MWKCRDCFNSAKLFYLSACYCVQLSTCTVLLKKHLVWKKVGLQFSPHLWSFSGSLKWEGTREKNLLIFIQRSDWGTQPLWACMAWYFAICLAMCLKKKCMYYNFQYDKSSGDNEAVCCFKGQLTKRWNFSPDDLYMQKKETLSLLTSKRMQRLHRDVF